MIIGLTGQTGAGKSTVCDFLKKKGLIIVDCDKVAREVTQKGSETLVKLAEVFGKNIISENGELDRKALAQIAFSSQGNTQKLNDITHPAIINAIRQKLSAFQNKNVVLDAPTLFESGADRLCDKIIAVIANEDVRKQRIMKRDNISHHQAQMRINAQKNDDFYKERAQAIIINNESADELEKLSYKALLEIGVI